MKDHTEQHLDSLAKKTMKFSSLESPSVDFTAKLMKQVESIKIGSSLQYKPLISKFGWFGITAILVGLSIYIMFGNVESSTLLDVVDYSVISNNKVTHALSGIKFSKTLTYAIGLFGLVFFIQIPLMKHLMNKRLEF
jgi:O6-methylguanine-DNA--protein-cysteine methyltransferase